MTYAKQTWADDDVTKPVSALRMAHIEDGIDAAHNLLTTPAIVRAFTSANFAAVANQWAKFALNSHDFDTDVGWEDANGRYVAKRSGWFYFGCRVDGQIDWPTGAELQIALYKNGVNQAGIAGITNGSAQLNPEIRTTGGMPVYLNAGDTVELWYYTDQGGGSTSALLYGFSLSSALASPGPWLVIPNLQNGITAYTTPSYRKDAQGAVHFKGEIQIPNGGLAAGTLIFNLPVGYRPATRSQLIVSCNVAGQSIQGLTVNTDGAVRVNDNQGWPAGGLVVVNLAAVHFWTD